MRIFSKHRKSSKSISKLQTTQTPVSHPETTLEVPEDFDWKVFEKELEKLDVSLFSVNLKANTCNIKALTLAEEIFLKFNPTCMEPQSNCEALMQGVRLVSLVGGDAKRKVEVRVKHTIFNIIQEQGIALYIVMNEQDFAVHKEICKNLKPIFLFVDMGEQDINTLLGRLSSGSAEDKSLNYSYQRILSDDPDNWNLESLVNDAILLMGNAQVEYRGAHLTKSARMN